MKFLSARQAWHDAFFSRRAGASIAEIMAMAAPNAGSFRVRQFTARADNSSGVQYTAKGADNKIISDVEMGIVQNLIEKLKTTDPLAYHWGMYAYTPDGTASPVSKAKLLAHLMAEYDTFKDKHPDRTKVAQLAYLTVFQCAKRDATGQVPDFKSMRRLMGCDLEQFRIEWRAIHDKLVRRLDKLPERALSPIASGISKFFGDNYGAPLR